MRSLRLFDKRISCPISLIRAVRLLVHSDFTRHNCHENRPDVGMPAAETSRRDSQAIDRDIGGILGLEEEIPMPLLDRLDVELSKMPHRLGRSDKARTWCSKGRDNDNSGNRQSNCADRSGGKFAMLRAFQK